MIQTSLSLRYLSRPPKVQAPMPPLLILLHGVGSNEHDLFGLAPELDERFLILSVRAPLTLGPGSYAWFRVQFINGEPQIDAVEAEKSRKTIIQFIGEATQALGVDPARVYLLGFSQGAIISQSVMLTRPELLAGVIAMSGRIIPEVKPLVAPHERLERFPVLVQHGLYDDVLPIRHGHASRDYLSTLPLQLTYREYEMGHQVSQESLDDARAWLARQVDIGGTRQERVKDG